MNSLLRINQRTFSFALCKTGICGSLLRRNLFRINHKSSKLPIKSKASGWSWSSSHLFAFPASAFLVYCSSSTLDDGKTPNSSEIYKTGRLLLQAIQEGNNSQVFRVLKSLKSWSKASRNSVLNFRHSFGWTPLMVASINGNTNAVDQLLDNGADPNLGDEYYPNRRDGLLYREEEFSDRLNPRADFRGFTALHYCVLVHSKSILENLLKHGADPSLKNNKGHFADEYASDEATDLKEMLEKAKVKTKQEKAELEAKERAMYPLEHRLEENIIGQTNAISRVSSAIRRKQNGWYDEDHPLVFLFLGSSGIGKTELAKQLANYLHKNNKKGFIRLDMSEYQEKHEVAKLIGSPPGYIGHDQGGQLTKQLKAQPNAVVLFDEVDKAHTDVLTVLLQLFDEGRLTDGQGRTVECKDAVFVMTSNLAADEIAEYGAQLRQEAKDEKKKKLSRSDTEETFKDQEAVVSRSFKERVVRPILKRHFGRDEFLGRINEFVYFLPFSDEELVKLVERELTMWAKHAQKKHGIRLKWQTPQVPSLLADGYNIHYGARSIKYEVDRRVVSLLATAHERGMLKKGCSVTIQNSRNRGDSQNKGCLELEIIAEDRKRTVFDEKEIANVWKFKTQDVMP